MTSLRTHYIPHGITPQSAAPQGNLPLGYVLIAPSGRIPRRTASSLLTPNYSLIPMHLQNFGTLAQRYYPDKTYRTATRLFRRELEVTKGLLRALKRVGYSPTSRLLTSTQVRVIEEFIGEAG